MFDRNKNVKVGRDINIQIGKQKFEALNNDELVQKENNSKLILKKENVIRVKRTFNWVIFWIMLFLLLYLGIPYFFENHADNNSLIAKFLKLLYNEKTWGLLSGIASFLAILNPINDIWKTSNIEKKQYEILKEIRTIMKEREYLKRSS